MKDDVMRCETVRGGEGGEVGTKAEHECGSPAAHYRYTRGKTRRYGNSRIRVTCHRRSTRIWVLVLVLRVLATSTCETKVLFYFILLIHPVGELSPPQGRDSHHGHSAAHILHGSPRLWSHWPFCRSRLCGSE